MSRTPTAAKTRIPDPTRRFRLEALEARLAPTADPLSGAVPVLDGTDADQVLVGRVYQDLLNRLPEPEGLAFWSGALARGATASQLGDAITHTTEYKHVQIHNYYLRLLGRTADDVGRSAFVGLLDRDASLGEIPALIASSAEFYAGRGGGSRATFAEALYRDALGRAPTAGEVAAASGVDPVALAQSVYGSPEARRAQIGDLYHRFLGRDGDADGLAYWDDRLARGTTLQGLTAALVGSTEYAGRQTPLGASLSGGGPVEVLPSAGLGALGVLPEALSLGPPLVFQSFTPERWIDTRAAFPPANNDGIMTPGEVRTFDIRGVASDQGNFLPAGTVAISATLFVVGSTNPSGHWAAYPADLASVPNIASIYSDHAGAIIASSLILPLGTTGANAGKIKVFSGPGGDIVLDINGVFLRDFNTGDQLALTTNKAAGAGLSVLNNGTGAASGVQGQIGTSAGSMSAGVLGVSDSSSANTNGVAGVINSTTTVDSAGVIGVTSSPTARGVWGVNLAAGPGVLGQSTVAGSIGVQGSAPTTGGGLAGRFDGNVSVFGTLTKSAGSFLIDHPLDPANRTLSHSFVESPDMMNVYNGNVVTDAAGEATVVLPDYFEALNRDYRYQLTVLGQFAQAIVARKVENNRFTIRTDLPNVEVSWQVTGIRQDAYANAHRIPVEQDKAASARGFYFHPELFGQPEDRRLGGPAPTVPVLTASS